MNGRAIPGAYLFRLYVCDKEMSSSHHIGETHQPDWVVYVRDSKKFRLTNVIPERIIFVSRGITVLHFLKIFKVTFYGFIFSCSYIYIYIRSFKYYVSCSYRYTRVGTLIVETIYLQLIQNRYMFRIFTVLQCSHQHCVQPVASDVEVVGYL